ncbi:hypothetical protein [Nonomuraea basaltis]|uniref:hypothetical protein n=1 Tax=Nonomuraea basaltis TaxID=2495887 RepID=UPI00110C5F09|nr:hypothetical protein [Nonomuraea basaltis]TMR97315.1 hypothetical protein EJK15_18765 [Nonomuraea basaltis]
MTPGGVEEWGRIKGGLADLPRDPGLPLQRLTPTSVGTGREMLVTVIGVAAHPPQAWGGAMPDVRSADLSGSPPQAWGPELSIPKFGGHTRLTPTGVGAG